MTDSGPVSIGATLKQRRLQKGLTLEAVNADLRIQTRFLKALEEERWGELPANVFLEGFLVKYAEYLGLDAVGLRTRLRGALGQSGEPAFTHPAPVAESLEGESMIPLRLFLLGLALVAVVGGGILFFRRPEPEGVGSAKPLNQVTETEPVFRSTSTVSAAPAVETSTSTPKSGNTLVLRAKEPVWVRVRLDDAVRFEGTLTAGELRTWPFASALRLRVGNVSRISVVLNGKTLAESAVAAPGDMTWPLRGGGDPVFQLPPAAVSLPPPPVVFGPVNVSTAPVPAPAKR